MPEVSQYLHQEGKHPHKISLDAIEILDRKQQWFEREMREAVFIWQLHLNLKSNGVANTCLISGIFSCSHVTDLAMCLHDISTVQGSKTELNAVGGPSKQYYAHYGEYNWKIILT